MFKQIEKDESIGKTIKCFVPGWGSNRCSNSLIVFEDNTFLCISAERGYDGYDNLDFEDPFNFREFPMKKLELAGIMTQADFDAILESERKKEAERLEQTEKKMYEKLKKKYG